MPGYIVKMHGNRTPPDLSSYGSYHIFAKIGGLCGGVTDTYRTSQYLSLQETASSLVVFVKRPCSVVRACASCVVDRFYIALFSALEQTH